MSQLVYNIKEMKKGNLVYATHVNEEKSVRKRYKLWEEMI